MTPLENLIVFPDKSISVTS
ncbi:hypothetical protein YPPY34_3560, partial [Yersinia pestis PY-34]